MSIESHTRHFPNMDRAFEHGQSIEAAIRKTSWNLRALSGLEQFLEPLVPERSDHLELICNTACDICIVACDVNSAG